MMILDLIQNIGMFGNNIHRKFMNSKKVLILGANGMLGKMMSLYFSSLNDYSTVLTSRESSNFLINNFDDNVEVFNVVEDDFQALASKVKPDIIINCIGRIKPTINEEDNLSITETIKINSFFPMELQKYSKTNKIHYFQIGTDCVFSGKKGNYLEDDFQDADDLYGNTLSHELQSTGGCEEQCCLQLFGTT